MEGVGRDKGFEGAEQESQRVEVILDKGRQVWEVWDLILLLWFPLLVLAMSVPLIPSPLLPQVCLSSWVTTRGTPTRTLTGITATITRTSTGVRLGRRLRRPRYRRPLQAPRRSPRSPPR